MLLIKRMSVFFSKNLYSKIFFISIDQNSLEDFYLFSLIREKKRGKEIEREGDK